MGIKINPFTGQFDIVGTAGGGGGGTVTNVTASGPLASSGGTTPNITLVGVIPIANGGTGQTSASAALSALGGANTFLSNLTSPTAVNQDINPALDVTYSLGVANRFQRIGSNIGFITHLRDASNDDSINPYVRQLYFPGAFGNGTALDYSGNNVLTVGGLLDMNTHKISNVVDPTLAQDAATKNYVDSQTSLGANKALSNLASVAINTSLLPGTDNSIFLGSTSKRWGIGYIQTLRDVSDVNSVVPASRQLQDTSGNMVVSWATANTLQFNNGGLLALKGDSGAGSITLKAHATSGSYTIIFPAAQGGANTVLTNDSAGNLSWSASSGANQQLSNLSSVAINTSLNPGTNEAFNSGASTTLHWFGVGSKQFNIYNGTSVYAQITANAGITIGKGSSSSITAGLLFVSSSASTGTAESMVIQSTNNESGDMYFGSGIGGNSHPSGNIYIYSGFGGVTSSNTGNVEISTGNAQGSNNAGNILLKPGTSVSGTNGIIQATAPIVFPSYTVATLPSASATGAGARAFVTDAVGPAFGVLVAGSGAVFTPVYSDGTNWYVG